MLFTTVANTTSTFTPFVGIGLKPIPLKSLPRVRSGRESLFLITDSKSKILNKIDLRWQEGYLFSPNVKLKEYIFDLITFVSKDHGEFLEIAEDRKPNFTTEFFKLSERNDLDLSTKAVCLTQALELALLGINTTEVLSKINKNDNQDGLPDQTKGYRQEILASWYLAKFIYKIKEPETDRFRHSVIISSCNHETDIVTEDAFVSVKSKSSYTKGLNEQIFKLFRNVIESNSQDFVTRLILIRKAVEPYQYAPDYIKTGEHKNVMRVLLDETRNKVLHDRYLKDYSDYLSHLDIEIYFVPDANDNSAIGDWIEQNYEWQEKRDSYYMYSKPTKFCNTSL